MKKIIIYPFLFLLSCCSTNIGVINSILTEDEQFSYPINTDWKNIFEQNENCYFVYVYSLKCQYCNSIKKNIIEFSHKYPVYFVEYCDDIPLITNIETTIGVGILENVGIKGTPTLIKIENRKIEFNIAGKNEILNFISLIES